MVAKSQGRARKYDLPIVTEWVTAAEAAKMAGVSRQYMHNCALKFESASRLSDLLVFRRTEIEKWVRDREAEMEPAARLRRYVA